MLACIELSNSTSHINLLTITQYRLLICTKPREYEQPKKMTYRMMKCQKFISHCII